MEKYKSLFPFLPLLAWYLLFIVLMAKPEFHGDEIRYTSHVEMILNGQYTDADNPNIRHGPLFPMTLLPIAWVGLPWLFGKILNAFWLVGGMMFLYEVLRKGMGHRPALIAVYIVGLFPTLQAEIMYLAYEPLAVFLMCGYLYYLVSAMEPDGNIRQAIFAGLFLGGLALTKTMIGHVTITMAILTLGVAIWKRTPAVWRGFWVHVSAIVAFIPYLLFMYSLTGKPFFWGNQGGEILYWKTSPHAGEFGSWFQSAKVLRGDRIPDLTASGNEQLIERHQSVFQSIQGKSFIEQDEALKAIAKENLKKHPEAFVANSAASFVRLWFNFPFSYTPQKMTTLFHLIPGMLLLVMLGISLLIGLWNLPRMPMPLVYGMLFAMIYIGGITLLNGRTRHLIPIMPILIWFISYVWTHWIKLSIAGPSSPEFSQTNT
ncbi:glycosyltransferase family 39 protein [Pontibacter sp. G13]|uniref:ArnT family glycosyltransferase n=1 Tax=Pontibacter sp. G13 TaxID=3074898 RepID=UPI00288BEAE5|nr:glycosyltransferase family 39 protein [Pontibacter sp. G13]WNJ17074.1 glycosyltransferase family 39 protein [Pontibacter sp. G13]